MLKLSAILDTAKFEDNVLMGLITRRELPNHPDVQVYSYGKSVQYSGLWTRETMLARGLILRVENYDYANATVIARGLPKFFTIEQVDSDWGRVKLVDDDEGVTVAEAPEIDWDSSAIVADKLNGALGIGFMNPDGVFQISTKGSFESLEANAANRVLALKYDTDMIKDIMKKELLGKTPLFEIITPERPHPIDYGNLEDLIYLGYMDNETGVWTPATMDHALADWADFKPAPIVNYDNLRDAVASEYRPDTEGFVVTVNDVQGDQSLYKVKPNEYLALRHFFYATQGKKLRSILEKITNESILAIEAPEDIDLETVTGVTMTANNKRLFDDRKAMIFESFIKPVRSVYDDSFNLYNEVIATLPEGYSDTDFASVVKTHYKDSATLLFRIKSGGPAASERMLNIVRKGVIKTI